ncbi:hypothetical protein ACFPRL_30985 [Pseudoclavibacter helvolus]
MGILASPRRGTADRSGAAREVSTAPCRVGFTAHAPWARLSVCGPGCEAGAKARSSLDACASMGDDDGCSAGSDNHGAHC